MTREEAIQYWKPRYEHITKFLEETREEPSIREYAEAIDMAIEALSADAVSIHEDGTLEVKVPNAHKVGRVLVMDTDSHIGGGLFYPDDAEADPMTEEVREALMRLSMCAREDCKICKYKDKCNFDFQYEESTRNMNTILDSLMRSKCEVDAKWIPCSEKLPKENEYVGNVCKYYLIQDEYGDMHVAHLSGRGWETIESIKALGCDVLAWMPLPEPYKGGDTE